MLKETASPAAACLAAALVWPMAPNSSSNSSVWMQLL
jgi:hypothetical protein